MSLCLGYGLYLGARSGGGGGGSSGGTSATRYSFAATRFRFPTTSRAVSGSNTYLIQQFVFGSPAYDVQNPRFFMPGFVTLTTGVANSEVANQNTIMIEGLSIKVGGVWYAVPATNLPMTIDPATMPGVLLDAIPVTIPANSVIEGRVAYNVPASGSLPTCPRAAVFGASGKSESSQGGTSSLAAKLTDNTALSNANAHADTYIPAYMVAQGGDGRPAMIVVGDSIGYGANESSGALSPQWSDRGAFGYIQRGLDDASASKRIAHATLCIPGTKPLDWQDRTKWAKKLDAIKAVHTATGDWPFDDVISQHGTNSIAAGTNFATLLAGMKAYYELMTAEWGKPITQVELLPLPVSSDGYATLENQTPSAPNAYPSGQRWQLNAAIGTDGEPDPASALRAGGWITDSFAPWKLGSYDTGSNRDKLKVLPFNTTLAAAAAQGATSFSMIAPPAVGQYLSIGGQAAFGIVTAVSGSGPYNVTLGITTPVPAGGIASGAPVQACMHDGAGTHPGVEGHRDIYAGAVVAWKQRRGWA